MTSDTRAARMIGGLADASRRETVDGVKSAFDNALAIASGGGVIKIEIDEGDAGDLSIDWMLATVAAVGHSRAKALIEALSPRHQRMTSISEDLSPIEAVRGGVSTDTVPEESRSAERRTDGSAAMVVRPRAKPLTRGEGTVTPTLRPFLAFVREVAERRCELLGRLRDALERGAHDDVVSLARQLVGLSDAPR